MNEFKITKKQKVKCVLYEYGYFTALFAIFYVIFALGYIIKQQWSYLVISLFTYLSIIALLDLLLFNRNNDTHRWVWALKYWFNEDLYDDYYENCWSVKRISE